MTRPIQAAAPTLEQYFRHAVRVLRRARLAYGHGTSSAAEEAATLIAYALGIPPPQLELHRTRLLRARELGRLERLLDARVTTRAPLAYLTREAWLAGTRFHVNRDVLIPRSPLSELLVDRLSPWFHRPPRRVLDLCTGSGCLAILAARAFEKATVVASDVSSAALRVAARNVSTHRLTRRVRLHRSDLFTSLPSQRFDLIICNPPYVTARSMRALPMEYRHEPALGLAGGRQGLDFVTRVLAEARPWLAPRGLLVCEIGRNRCSLERAYPDHPFVWLDTSIGMHTVFLLDRASL